MCIFTAKIDTVESTRIFSRLAGSRQAVVYDMHLTTRQETAMVLPVPVARNKDADLLEFVDLSGYTDFFDDLESLFPKPPVSRNAPLAADALSPRLEVERVGSFEASFVPSTRDFKRLDPRFQLPSAVLQKLPTYNDHAFVVFKFRSGESQIHPMAFWFETRDTDHLFYPTVHVHDGQVHETEAFNHVLYAQGVDADSDWPNRTRDACGSELLGKATSRSYGIVSESSELVRQSLWGDLPNTDTWVRLS